jgi:hypothetical protein
MIEEFKETYDDYITTLDISNSMKGVGVHLSVICLTMLSYGKPTKNLLVG